MFIYLLGVTKKASGSNYDVSFIIIYSAVAVCRCRELNGGMFSVFRYRQSHSSVIWLNRIHNVNTKLMYQLTTVTGDISRGIVVSINITARKI